MTNQSHTLGPWQVNATSTRVSSAQYDTVANIAVNHVSEEARRVNAALIAAAPELLAALQRCIAVMEQRCPEASPLPDARAAIANATGGAS